ncbi:hypothetical protein EFW58_04188 [Bacillus velezensis]|nr:hypothetical protein EFW58_04188 [Bacillus velezensis]
MCLFLAKREKSRIQSGSFSYKCHIPRESSGTNAHDLQPIKLVIASPV